MLNLASFNLSSASLNVNYSVFDEPLGGKFLFSYMTKYDALLTLCELTHFIL